MAEVVKLGEMKTGASAKMKKVTEPQVFHCEVCDAYLKGPTAYTRHRAGVRHIKRVAAKEKSEPERKALVQKVQEQEKAEAEASMGDVAVSESEDDNEIPVSDYEEIEEIPETDPEDLPIPPERKKRQIATKVRTTPASKRIPSRGKVPPPPPRRVRPTTTTVDDPMYRIMKEFTAQGWVPSGLKRPKKLEFDEDSGSDTELLIDSDIDTDIGDFTSDEDEEEIQIFKSGRARASARRRGRQSTVYTPASLTDSVAAQYTTF